MKDLLFSVDQHDSDGDVTEKCVLLHLGKAVILSFETGDDLEEFAQRILGLLPEIRENYPHAFADSWLTTSQP